MGRKPIPVWNRICPHITISTGADPWSIAKLEGVSPSSWPETLKDAEWNWDPSRVTKSRTITRNLRGMPYRMTMPDRPRISWKRKVWHVHRIVYTLLIGQIDPEQKLVTTTHRLDMNPLHWEFLKPKGSEYPFSLMDFVFADNEEAVEPLPDEGELDDVMQVIEEEYAKAPFSSWEEYRERVADDILFDVDMDVQIAALEACNLIQKLNPKGS